MTQPRPARDLLRGILADVGSRSQRDRLTRALHAAIGDSASGCEVLALRGGRLHVSVGSSPLFAELCGFRADAIRRAMNEQLHDCKISKIVFRMSGTSNA